MKEYKPHRYLRYFLRCIFMRPSEEKRQYLQNKWNIILQNEIKRKEDEIIRSEKERELYSVFSMNNMALNSTVKMLFQGYFNESIRDRNLRWLNDENKALLEHLISMKIIDNETYLLYKGYYEFNVNLINKMLEKDTNLALSKHEFYMLDNEFYTLDINYKKLYFLT